MNIEDLAIKQQKTEDRSIRNEGRIKKLEEESGVLNQLVTSVAVMAEQMKTMNSNVSTMKNELEELKEKPGKRWDSLIDKIVWAIAAALIGFALAQIGL